MGPHESQQCSIANPFEADGAGLVITFAPAVQTRLEKAVKVFGAHILNLQLSATVVLADN